MAIDPGLLEEVREQLSVVEPVTIKRMFGGAGIYARGYFFALVAEGSLYFKTDDSNRDDYLTLHSPAFAPWGDDGMKIDYHELPDAILDHPQKLRVWMEKAIEVAIAAKERKKKPKKKKAVALPTRKHTPAAKRGKMKRAEKAGEMKKAARPRKVATKKAKRAGKSARSARK